MSCSHCLCTNAVKQRLTKLQILTNAFKRRSLAISSAKTLKGATCAPVQEATSSKKMERVAEVTDCLFKQAIRCGLCGFNIMDTNELA